MENATTLVTVLANRVHELEQHNARLRSRVSKLERSRDEWRQRATSTRTTINRLRSRVTDARRSRDLWKHRAMR